MLRNNLHYVIHCLHFIYKKNNAMNKIILPLLLVLLSATGFAQTEKNPFPRTITVTGSSEMEIVPDEIYVQVDLKEYEKKGQDKVSIEKIKSDFLKNIRAIGIPDSLVSIAAYEGDNGNPWLRKKKKKEELMSSIAYQLKLKSSKQLDDVVAVLDDNATQNFSIIRTSHSRMEEFRKQLKIQAVKAAKEKAGYLAGAIGEHVGVAVTINEPGENFIPYYNLRSNVMMKEAGAADDVQSNVDFRKIKLKFEVSVVFALE